jgi:hypothetical protein
MGVIQTKDRLGDRHMGSALLSELSELFLEALAFSAFVSSLTV